MRSEVLDKLSESTKAVFQEMGGMQSSSKVITERNDLHFDFLYYEVSAKTGEGIEESMRTCVERVSKEKLAKRAEAKRERDFGLTVLDPKVSNQSEQDVRRNCCQPAN